MQFFKENRIIFRQSQTNPSQTTGPEKEKKTSIEEPDLTEERRTLLLDTISENLEKKDMLKEAGENRAEQIELVKNIDLDKTVEEQQPSIDILEGFLLTELPKLFEAGIKIEKLSDITQAIATIDEKTAEKIDIYGGVQSLIMLRKISNNPSCKLATSWKFDTEILPKIKTDYARAVQLRDTKVDEVKEEPEGFFGKMISWIKDNKKIVIGTIALAGAIGAGAYIYKKMKNKAPGFVTLGATGLGAVSAGLVLGSILGTEGWKKWIDEKLGTNFALTNIIEAIPYLFKGEFVKAMEILKRGEIEIDSVSKLIGGRLGIDPEKVALLRDQNLENFMSKGNEVLTQTIGAGTQIGTSILSVISPSKESTFIGENIEEKSKLIKAEKALIEYFKRPDIQEAISKMSPKPKTIGELLDELARSGQLNTAGVAAAPRPTEDKEDKETPEDEELGIFVDGGSWERFKKLGGDHFPSTKRHLETFIENPSKSLLSLEFYKGLISSVKEDGGALMSFGGILYLVKDGYTFFALGSSEIILNSLKELGEAFMFEDESYLDAGKSWVKDSMGFVVIMSAFRIGANVLTALANNIKQSKAGEQIPIIRSIAKGAAQGTLEGLAMPVTVVKAHVFGGQAAYRFIKDTKLGRDIAAADADIEKLKRSGIAPESTQFQTAVETAQNVKLQRLKFYAELYKRYNDLYEQTRGIDLSDPKRKLWAETNMARIESLRRKYAIKFSKLYKRLYEDGTLPKRYFDQIDEDMSEENPSKVKGRTDRVIEMIDEQEKAILEERINIKTEEIRRLRQEGKLNESGIKELENIKTEEILKSRGIDPTSREASAYLEEWDKRIAEQIESGARINPKVQFRFEGAKPSIELVVKKGKVIAKYLGTEIEMESIPESATKNPTFEVLEQSRKQCETKWKITAEAVTQVDYIYDKTTGKFKPTFNGQELPEGFIEEGSSAEAATKRYVQALEDGKIEVPRDFARNIAKYGTYLPQLELILGTAGAAYMIYEIETAKDKKATLIKQFTLLGTGLYAAGRFEKKWGWKIKNPYLNAFGALMAGIIGATVGDKMIEPIVQAIVPNIPGIQGVSLELGEVLSKYVTYKFTIKPAIELASRKGVTKGLERQLAKYMEKKVFKEGTEKGIKAAIKRIATSQVIKRIIITAVGPKRAATILACFADDALGLSGVYAPVALITDILGAGMLIWSAYDIAQAIAVYMNAVRLNKEIEARECLKIKEGSIRIMEDDVMRQIEQQGVSLDDLSNDEDRLFDFLAHQPKVTIEMEREGRPGSERWFFENGVAVGIEIWNGKVKTAGITGMDAEMMEESAHEIERQNPDLMSSDPQEEQPAEEEPLNS